MYCIFKISVLINVPYFAITNGRLSYVKCEDHHKKFYSGLRKPLTQPYLPMDKWCLNVVGALLRV